MKHLMQQMNGALIMISWIPSKRKKEKKFMHFISSLLMICKIEKMKKVT